MKYTTILILLLFSQKIIGQIEIDKSIIFNNTSDELRNITNVGEPTSNTNGVAIKHKNVKYAEAIENSPNIINLTTSTQPITITEGLQFQFISPITNSSNVIISINNQGNFNIVKPDLTALSANEITIGQIIDIIFNGSEFQMLYNTVNPNCLDGYAEVNENLCIELNSHAPLNWFEAVEYCMEKEARLCNWAEFGAACDILTGNGDFNSAWEWTRTTGDHHRGARIVGNNTCNNANYQQTLTTTARFRCCKTK